MVISALAQFRIFWHIGIGQVDEDARAMQLGGGLVSDVGAARVVEEGGVDVERTGNRWLGRVTRRYVEAVSPFWETGISSSAE